MQLNLSIISPSFWSIRILFVKLLPMPMWFRVLPIFFYSNSTVKSLHKDLWFTLNLYECKVRDWNIISVCRLAFSFPNTIYWRGYLSSNAYFAVLCQKAIASWVCDRVFYSIPLVFMPAFVPLTWCFYYSGSGVYFEVRYCDTSTIALFSQDCFWYSRTFVLPYEH
jgi:hypothetical protein